MSDGATTEASNAAGPAWKLGLRGTMPTGVPLQALPLYVFLHVPKTAGTSARQMWRWISGDFYFHYNHELHHAKAGQAAVWDTPGFFDRFLMIGGHVDLTHPLVQAARATGRRLIFIGVVRDPVARVVSLYDFVRRQPRHPLLRELRERTLLQAIEHGGQFTRAFAANAQLAQLFGTADPAGIEAALATENYLIGRQDQLDALFDAVSAVSGLPRPHRMPQANTAEKLTGPAVVAARDQPDFQQAAARIAELNKLEAAFIATRIPTLLRTTALQPKRPPQPAAA